MTLAWVPFHGLPEQGGAAVLSFLLQQVTILLVYALVDRRLRSARVRFLLASTVALYVAFVQLDALLIEVVGLSCYRTLIMFTAGGWSTLSEIGLKPTRLALLIGAVIGMCATGGVGHRFLDRWRVELPKNGERIAWTFGLAILPIIFVGEQVLSRDSDRYVYRSLELPGYYQIYETASRSEQLALQSPVETIARHEHLESIGPARNPKHVLLILLESVRADAIDPAISPTLWSLAKSGLDFKNARAESIFTPLSWNVILLDRPPHMFMWPRTMLAPRAPGSWPLNVLRRAGYRIWVSSSTDLGYGHFLPFMLGEHHLVDRLNVVKADHLERWQRDDRATNELIRWIESSPLDGPIFMMLQLDSTHWTYQFPPDRAVVNPYSKPLSMPVPVETEEEFRLLRNRYLNCVHHVDSKVAEVLTALERRGIADETAVIAVADHGEGFTPGVQGHAVLCDQTTRIPLIMRLPGIEPEALDGLVTFRNLFPTLFDYLDIESLDPNLMLGRSVLPPNEVESEVLIFAPDGRRADLIFDDGRRMQFNVLMQDATAFFTPVGAFDRSFDWRGVVERWMRVNAPGPARDPQETAAAPDPAKAPSG